MIQACCTKSSTTCTKWKKCKEQGPRTTQKNKHSNSSVHHFLPFPSFSLVSHCPLAVLPHFSTPMPKGFHTLDFQGFGT